MSNRKKLRPPPTGYSYEKFRRVVMESGLPEDRKIYLLRQALHAGKKGWLRSLGREARRMEGTI